MNGKHVLLIVGVGRSGTSLMTGILSKLGWHVPQPEMVPNTANVRGFWEPRWVVEFHGELLRDCHVGTMDSRPAAFELTHSAASHRMTTKRLTHWLSRQLSQSPWVAIKDPRTAWFLPLWRDCASALGADTSFITMLRDPTEVVVSARRSFDVDRTDASLLASWINIMLSTERATRGASRSFVSYECVLSDWWKQVQRLAADLGLPGIADISSDQRAAVDALVDPGLHRSAPGWDKVDVPAHLREVAQATWAEFNRIAEGGRAFSSDDLDGLAAAYQQIYAEAEAISESSCLAARAMTERVRLRSHAAAFARASWRKLPRG